MASRENFGVSSREDCHPRNCLDRRNVLHIATSRNFVLDKIIDKSRTILKCYLYFL